MRYAFLFFAVLALGCSDDPVTPQPKPFIPSAGSIFTFEETGLYAQGIDRDTFLTPPATFNGRSDLAKLHAWYSFPFYISYEQDGDIATTQDIGNPIEWWPANYGTKTPYSASDPMNTGYASVTHHEYRDTVLEVMAKTYPAVKEDRHTGWEELSTGIFTVEPSGHSYTVWIPSLGYYGLNVVAEGSDDFSMSKLIAFELK
ncbi:MAG TPA: hypothetical protein VFH43_13580 [Candidatus Kapabacteria bacterium]|nr:hypothetical protein [Candidatus Kapabacteria bacterium]